jgi:hypothetical protein
MEVTRRCDGGKLDTCFLTSENNKEYVQLITNNKSVLVMLVIR